MARELGIVLIRDTLNRTITEEIANIAHIVMGGENNGWLNFWECDVDKKILTVGISLIIVWILIITLFLLLQILSF